MAATLNEIVAATRVRVAAARRKADLSALERQARGHMPRQFRKKLLQTAESDIAIIAELKRASPSKGLIRADFQVAPLARELALAGAAALSVLTDEKFFKGSLENLCEASAATQLPCLRKDFIVEEFQLLEARAHCADAALLIVAALSQAELTALVKGARELELDVLCEVHDEEEFERAQDCGCDLIGVNSRDLRTFKVDLATAFRMAERFPKNIIAVAESGIQSGNDIARLRAAGYQCFLIGESLMRAPSPGEALQRLIREASVATSVDSSGVNTAASAADS
jgi:indole-3-glycerol phosphate synthase